VAKAHSEISDRALATATGVERSPNRQRQARAVTALGASTRSSCRHSPRCTGFLRRDIVRSSPGWADLLLGENAGRGRALVRPFPLSGSGCAATTAMQRFWACHRYCNKGMAVCMSARGKGRDIHSYIAPCGGTDPKNRRPQQINLRGMFGRSSRIFELAASPR
jgi:hypothetical protein